MPRLLVLQAEREAGIEALDQLRELARERPGDRLVVMRKRVPFWQFPAAETKELVEAFVLVDPAASPARALERALAHARERRIDGVLSIHEECLRTGAQIAAALGLRGPTPRSVELCRDKLALSETLGRAGLSVPRARWVRRLADARAFADEHGYPVVLKPRDMAGAIGVVRAGDPTELSRAWRIASRARWAGARLAGVMIQEFLTGGVIAVNAWVDAGRVELLLASDKTTCGEPFFSTEEEVAPTRRVSQSELADVIRRAVHALAIEHAVVHAELAVGSRGLAVLELTPRPGGGPVPHMVRAATGTSLLALGADLALGRPPSAAVANRAAGFRILRAQEPGRIARLKTVGELPPPVQLRLTADVGDRIRLPPESFVDPLGWVVAGGDDCESVRRALDDASRKVRLELVAPHGPRSVWALARRVARRRYRRRLLDRLRVGAP